MPVDEEANRAAAHAVATFGPDLYRYAVRRVRSQHDADDVIAAVFMVIWERRRRLPRAESELRMWCFGVARNKVHEHHRAARRHGILHTTADLSLLPSVLADPETAAIDGDEAARVRRALNDLDPRSRELVMLIHWERLSIAEASRVLNLNESSARTRYARARARLALLLASRHDAGAAGTRSRAGPTGHPRTEHPVAP